MSRVNPIKAFILFYFSLSLNCIFAQSKLNEEIVYIPKQSVFGDTLLETTIFKPNGNGPFPLVIINHGMGPGNSHNQPRYRPLSATRYFLERNYAVIVPMRPGFSKSGGTYSDGGCSIESNGFIQAEVMNPVIAYAHNLPYINSNLTLIVGQSHGGWATLAYGATDVEPSIKGLVNFAGGLKNTKCPGWKSGLVSASEYFGSKTKLPSLWLYGDNDSYFPRVLSSEMFDAYIKGNPRSTFFAYGNFGFDSHRFFINGDSRPIWTPPMDQFLGMIGMPNKVVNSGYKNPPRLTRPPKTNYAQIDEIDKVPFISDAGKAAYKQYISTSDEKAFAISKSGKFAWEYGTDDPLAGALESCSGQSQTPCSLYAVDEDVVWVEK
jgi:dienelactone hydrolase